MVCIRCTRILHLSPMMFWRCLQYVFKTSCENVFKIYSKRLLDVFKTSCKNDLEDAFPSKRLPHVLQRCHQQIGNKMFWKSFIKLLVNMSLRLLWDSFNTFLRRTAKTIIYRKICVDHTSEKSIIMVQNVQEWALRNTKTFITVF